MKYSIVEIGIAAMELDRLAKSPKEKVSKMAKDIKSDRVKFFQYLEIRRNRNSKRLETKKEKSFFSKLLFWK